jgi:hypothetical protein
MLAVVFDDFTGLTCFGLCYCNNLLSCTSPTSWRYTKVAAVKVSIGFDFAAMMPLKLG